MDLGKGLGRSEPWGDSRWSRWMKETIQTGIRIQNISWKKLREARELLGICCGLLCICYSFVVNKSATICNMSKQMEFDVKTKTKWNEKTKTKLHLLKTPIKHQFYSSECRISAIREVLSTLDGITFSVYHGIEVEKVIEKARNVGGSESESRHRHNEDETEFWGYVDVRPGAHMFYWLYHSDHPDGYLRRPLIIWLQVGHRSQNEWWELIMCWEWWWWWWSDE